MKAAGFMDCIPYPYIRLLPSPRSRKLLSRTSRGDLKEALDQESRSQLVIYIPYLTSQGWDWNLNWFIRPYKLRVDWISNLPTLSLDQEDQSGRGGTVFQVLTLDTIHFQ